MIWNWLSTLHLHFILPWILFSQNFQANRLTALSRHSSWFQSLVYSFHPSLLYHVFISWATNPIQHASGATRYWQKQLHVEIKEVIEESVLAIFQEASWSPASFSTTIKYISFRGISPSRLKYILCIKRWLNSYHSFFKIWKCRFASNRVECV